MQFNLHTYNLPKKTGDFIDILYTTSPFSLFTHILPNNTFTAQGNVIYGIKTEKNMQPKIVTKMHTDITTMSANNLGVAGDNTGKVKLFNDKGSLKEYAYHSARVNAVKIYNKRCILSCADDRTVIFNDLQNGHVVNRHDDYVSDVCMKENVIISGSSDGQILLYDIREKNNFHKIDVQQPVRYVNTLNSGIYIVTDEHALIVDIKNYNISKKIHCFNTSGFDIFDNNIFICSDNTMTIYDAELKEILFHQFNGRLVGIKDHVDHQLMVGLDNGHILSFKYRSFLKNDDIVMDKKSAKSLPSARNKVPTLHFGEKEHPITLLTKEFVVYDDYEKMLKKHEYRKLLTEVLNSDDDNCKYRILQYYYDNKLLRQSICKKNVCKLAYHLCKNLHMVVYKRIAVKCFIIITSVFKDEFVDGSKIKKRMTRAVKYEERKQRKCIETYAFLETLLDIMEKKEDACRNDKCMM